MITVVIKKIIDTRSILFTAVFFLILFYCSKNEKITGTVDTTDSGIKAMIYNADLTPAVGAEVSFYKIDDTSAIYKTETDIKGNYIVPAFANGTYTIIAKKDTMMSFQDSVFFMPNSNTVKSDTLGKISSLRAVAALQINHDPRTITVHVLGTDINSNVDEKGNFTLRPLAQGKYNVMLKTTIPDYTPKFISVNIGNGQNDTLKDTIFLIYTGIPVITNIKSMYDTINGVISLAWNKTNYRDFQDFLIYRDSSSAIQLTQLPLAASVDTIFTDTIFSRNLKDGPHSYSDTNNYTYKYRIAIRTNVTTVGLTYKHADVTAISPAKLKTLFSKKVYHIVKKIVTDSASVNDSLLCVSTFVNQTRFLKKVFWTDLKTGTEISAKMIDSTKKSGVDSIKYVWHDTGLKLIECAAIDNMGYISRDTFRIVIVNDEPQVKITTKNTVVAINDSIVLHIESYDRFGAISQIELKANDNTNFKRISGRDTLMFAPSNTTTSLKYFVQVTDEDGNKSIDSITFNVVLFKLESDSLPLGGRTRHNALVFDNKLFIIGGQTKNNFLNDVWFTEDGTSWILKTENTGYPVRSSPATVVFNNKMWVISGYDKNDVWNSSDGKKWDLVTSNTGFKSRARSGCVVFQNKIWIIGGITDTTLNDIWSSSDGVKWDLAVENAPFTRREGASVVVYDNKIWVIGGDAANGRLTDVWTTIDGTTWVQVSKATNQSEATVLVADNKLWACSLAGSTAHVHTQISNSTNGSDWTIVSDVESFTARSDQTFTYFKGKLWVIGGSAHYEGDVLNDSYSFSLP
jgi:hypothetical protein